MDATGKTIRITVEFSGGLELLFNNERRHNLELPSHGAGGKPSNLEFLIQHICHKMAKQSRTDTFVSNNTIRPGILVLINDADWELEGEAMYELKDEDSVMFVSTLHGG